MFEQILRFLSQMTPLVLAAVAALLSEYAGVLNVGIEGLMLIGSFAAVCTVSVIGGAVGTLTAFFCAACIGAVITAGMGYLILRWKANPYITGLAINLLAAGTVSVLAAYMFGDQSIILLSSGFLLSAGSIKRLAVFLAGVTAVAAYCVLYYTRTGMQLRVLGSCKKILSGIGVNTEKLILGTLTVSGALAALAGSLLPLQLGAFVPNQSAGKGWLALVLVFAGGKSVGGIYSAAVFFMLLENYIAAAQGSVEHPSLLVGLPFLLALVLIIVERLAVQWWNHPKRHKTSNRMP